jgi:hypothetical protein
MLGKREREQFDADAKFVDLSDIGWIVNDSLL